VVAARRPISADVGRFTLFRCASRNAVPYRSHDLRILASFHSAFPSLLVWIEPYFDEFPTLVSCRCPPPLINRALGSFYEDWMPASDLHRLNHPVRLHHGLRFHTSSQIHTLRYFGYFGVTRFTIFRAMSVCSCWANQTSVNIRTEVAAIRERFISANPSSLLLCSSGAKMT
jgi:hypothetical protein